MKLGLEHIKEITTGAAYIEEDNEGVLFHRFTLQQEELYRATSQNFYDKSQCTAGVKFSFRTNSENLFLKLKESVSGTRKYFSLDVFVDGKFLDCIKNFSEEDLPSFYTQIDCPEGDYSKAFNLGKGEKCVCVYFPWSVKVVVEEISVDEGSFIEPLKPEKKLLAYGDSITQGYDALHPSDRYVSKLSEKLQAAEFNKAIGGERFFPSLAKLRDDFTPDYITVAYGTNDWNATDEETFKKKCREFYLNVSQMYPESKIFAITPIWRKDMNESRIFGDFRKVEQGIIDATKDIENITVISGFDFVPKEEAYYADLRLHPNDKGFEYYTQNLYNKVEAFCKKG